MEEEEVGHPTDMKKHSERLEEQKKRMGDFADVLDSMNNLEDKKKLLWMHIYENALEDRTHAYMLFTQLYINTKGQPSEHHLNGPILAKYIERMSKANDQILKLAELVQKAQEEEEVINEEDLYKEIAEAKKAKKEGKK